MIRTVMVSTLLSVLLIAPSAHAFLGQFDQLEQELQQMEQADDTSELEGILQKLEEDSDQPGFSDVQNNAWYGKYVSSVARWGIVSGYRDNQGQPTGRFGPADPVTVAEILKMAMEAAQIDKEQCGAPQTLGARQHWAAAYVACAEQRDFRLSEALRQLNRPATRAEVLSILHDAFGDNIPPLISTFQDAEGHPLESDIAYAAARGVVSGDTNAQGEPLGTFRPNDQVNRAEAAKIIYEKLRTEVSE